MHCLHYFLKTEGAKLFKTSRIFFAPRIRISGGGGVHCLHYIFQNWGPNFFGRSPVPKLGGQMYGLSPSLKTGEG